MPPSASALSRSAIISRLRAAGCVFAEDEATLLLAAAARPADLAAMVERRVAGLPLEHILGWADFCGLRVAVDPGVFVPRRRTEFLVREAAALALSRAGLHAPFPASSLAGSLSGPRTVVVDLCCGSGAVGVALSALAAGVDLHAVDIDAAAVRCAGRNLAAYGGRAYQGDLYEPLPETLRGRVDLLIANAPYVPTEAIELMPPEARVHEPRVALDGGADGLEVQRRVAAVASLWLAPGGNLLIETSEDQAPLTVAAMAEGGLVPRVVSSPKFHATVVIGAMPGLEP